MTRSTTNLSHIDRLIAGELGVKVGDSIPAYTTDLNVAIELIDYTAHRVNGVWDLGWNMGEWYIKYHDEKFGGSKYGIDKSLALAICKARFPHLFSDKDESS
jgi:hypothetical protein